MVQIGTSMSKMIKPKAPTGEEVRAIKAHRMQEMHFMDILSAWYAAHDEKEEREYVPPSADEYATNPIQISPCEPDESYIVLFNGVEIEVHFDHGWASAGFIKVINFLNKQMKTDSFDY